jgi:hypothetical protein
VGLAPFFREISGLSLTRFRHIDHYGTFPVRVRFGSTEFLKSRFGFGSVQLNFQKVSSNMQVSIIGLLIPIVQMDPIAVLILHFALNIIDNSQTNTVL